MNDRKKIVLVLPRGEAIRNFVYSGTASLLRKSAHITIISVIPNQEIELYLKDNCDDFYELEETPVPYFLNLFWNWIDMVHGRWLWSGAAKMRWRIRDSEVRTLSQKIKRIVLKFLAYPFANRPGLEMLSKVESLLPRIMLRDKNYSDLFKDIKPDLVFNGSHIHSLISRPVMHSAKRLGIKTATFLFSWDNLTSQGRILPYHDYYLVWNARIKEDLLDIYRKVKDYQVLVTGTPQFDFHKKEDTFLSREKYSEIIGVDPARPIILYTTGMLNLMPYEDIIVEGLADICLQVAAKPQLVVRVYPKDVSTRFNALKKKRKDIFFPKIDWEQNFLTPTRKDVVLYSNMLFHCDIGINIASTVSLELCMFNKPVINIGYNPPGMDIAPRDFAEYYQWEHYKPISDSGAVSIAWKEEEMKGYIIDSIEHPETKSDMRQKLIKIFFGPYLDGMAYKRISKKILELSGIEI